MAADTAKLFADNQMDVFTPILPANQTMAPTVFEKSLSSIFKDVAPVPAAAMTMTPSMVFKPEASQIAANANIASESLRSIEGAQFTPQGGDAAYMGAQVGKLAMEAGGAALKLGGEAIGAFFGSVVDKDNDGIPDEQPKPVMAPAPMVGMPSPSGM